jgi:hypothetical protein
LRNRTGQKTDHKTINLSGKRKFSAYSGPLVDIGSLQPVPDTDQHLLHLYTPSLSISLSNLEVFREKSFILPALSQVSPPVSQFDLSHDNVKASFLEAHIYKSRDLQLVSSYLVKYHLLESWLFSSFLFKIQLVFHL